MSATSSLRTGRRPDPALQEAWQQRLLRFEQAGLPAPAFCASEGVSLPSFYSWKRRLRPPTAAAHTQPRLVSVRLLGPAPVEVVLPSGAVLRVSPGCDLTFVRSLLDALGGAPC
jgi:transposase